MEVWIDKYGETRIQGRITIQQSCQVKVVRQVRGDRYSSETLERLLKKPTQIPKPNTNENHEQVRGDPCHSDILEWLQEFRENLVDRVPEHRDSHASSSHGSSLEATPARSADLGKHSVYTHFPKGRNCEICQRTNITKAPCRRRICRVELRSEKLVIRLQPITKLSVKDVNLETIIDMQSWCKTWPNEPVVSVQHKNFSGKTKELAKVLGAEQEAKSHLH